MFKTRLLSGIILVLMLIIFGYLGHIPLLLFCAGISIMGLSEFYKALGVPKFIAAIGYCMSVIVYLDYLQQEVFATPILVLPLLKVVICFFIYMSAYTLQYPKYKFIDMVWGFIGIIYIPIMLSFFYQARNLPDGLYYVWLIIITAWGSDTSAYCVGKLFGKHKLAPILSPKKSVEGFIGGVIGSMVLFYIIYGIMFSGILNLNGTSLLVMTGFVGLCSVVSVIGDLTASAIKREHGIKDYGNIIPGHGGIMDRFDSVIFTAPLIYYSIIFAQKYLIL